jgi:hypothetical protein
VIDRLVASARPASCTALSPSSGPSLSVGALGSCAATLTNYIKNVYTRNPTDLREKYRAALKFITQFDAAGPDVYAFKVLLYLHHRANSLFGANLYKLCCCCRPEWMYDCVYLDARGAPAAHVDFSLVCSVFDDVQLSSACAAL